MLKKLDQISNNVINVMAIIARMIIVIIAFIILIDLISTNLFNHSLSWVLETSEYLLVFLTFLGTAWLLREDGHIKLDLILNAVNERNRSILELINYIIGFFVSLALTVSGFVVTWDLYLRGIKTEAVLEIHRYILIIIIPIGFMMLTIQFLKKIQMQIKIVKSNLKEG